MTDTNPYATPSAGLDSANASGNLILTEPRGVSAGSGWGWIAEGFDYFKQSPGAWILSLLVVLVIALVLNFIPVIGQIAWVLVSYVIAGGFMLGCRDQASGNAFKVNHVFAAFSKPGKLVLLSVVYYIGFFAIFIVIMIPFFGTIMSSGATSEAEIQNILLSDPTTILLPILFALLFMIPLAMAFWFAPLLIAIHDLPIFKALKLSFMGCLKNMLPFLVYGIIGLVLSLLAVIPLGLGLLVLVPTMIASVYVSYRQIFTQPATAR